MLNAKTLAAELAQRGQTIVTGGTDNHLLLWDARPLGISGSKLDKVLESVSITVNKNSIVGDVSAVTPGGVRIGTPALTSRGMDEEDMKTVARFLVRAANIGIELQKECLAENEQNEHVAEPPPKGGNPKRPVVKLAAFCDKFEGREDLRELKKEVEEFSSNFFMPGDDLN